MSLIQYIGFKKEKRDIVPGGSRCWLGHGSIQEVSAAEAKVYLAAPEFREVAENDIKTNGWEINNGPQRTEKSPPEAAATTSDGLKTLNDQLAATKRKLTTAEQAAQKLRDENAALRAEVQSLREKLAAGPKPDAPNTLDSSIRAALAQLDLGNAKHFKDGLPLPSAVQKIIGSKVPAVDVQRVWAEMLAEEEVEEGEEKGNGAPAGGGDATGAGNAQQAGAGAASGNVP